MSYELNVRADGSSPCRRCKGNAEHEVCEWVEEAAGVPLYRSIRRTVQCRSCGSWIRTNVDPVTRQKFPRLPGLMWRLVVTWLLLALLAAGVVAFFVNERRLRRGLVENPQVGDLWTVKAGEWPSVELENAARYGVLRVSTLDADEIGLFACNQTSDDESKIEDRCKTYRIELEPLTRAKVIELVDDGVITDVRSERDDYTMWIVIGGCWAALMVIHALLSRRFLRAAERATARPIDAQA